MLSIPPEYIYGIISLLGLSGFWLAFHIYQEKRKAHPLVCPLDFNCEAVVNSKYSKVFGVPVEVMGILYYLIITLGYAMIALYPPFATLLISQILYSVTTIGFGVSVLLTAIQYFVLKEFCTWCLLSAIVSTIIFTLCTISF